MGKMLKQGSMHVEPHNPAMEYSKADGGDYLDANEERAELMLDAHKAYYGQDIGGTAKILPSNKIEIQESSNAGDAGATSGSWRR